MKRLLILLAFLPGMLQAQTLEQPTSKFYSKSLWKNVQIGATAGSTGFGLDLKAPVAPNLSLRVGFNYMPKISRTSGFSMTSVSGSDDENLDDRTKRLASYLADMVGNEKIDNIVDMEIGLQFVNAKVLLDWAPLHNKHWHFTAGIYAGDRNFANACNTIMEGPTTTAMRLYNKMYDQISNLDEWEYPTITIGSVSVELDPETGPLVKDKFKKYGRTAVQVGELADGTPVCLEPDEDALLRASGKVNKVKPYLGAGYDTWLDKGKRWNLSADLGLMYWGTPHLNTKYDVEREITDEAGETKKVIELEDICLVHDVKKVRGVIGNYVRLAKHLPVYPVLEIRLGYRL